MAGTLHFEFGNGTDVGCVRSQNEDAFVLYEATDKRQLAEKGHLVLVCDGMGGAKGGRVASSMAVEEISNAYYLSHTGDVRTGITQAIKSANNKIHQRAKNEDGLNGMGTTAVAAILLGDDAYIAHVGDSRCYLIRNKEISLLTEDHTIVQKMVKQGLITADQARNHPEGHILSRSVGVHAEVEVDITLDPLTLQPGDILVLCSDGLHGQVEDDEILQIAIANPAQRAVEKLIALAKERGGPDNITVQIVRAHATTANNHVGLSTVRTAPLRKGALGKVLLFLILLIVIAGGVGALWLYEVVDFRGLLGGAEWVPLPPASLPPFK